MTKPLETDNTKYARPRPASVRIRALLVALLGFGAADLLVLNLWAVPKLITTTDLRAAQNAEREPVDSAASAAAATRPTSADPSAARDELDQPSGHELHEQVAHAPPQAQPELAGADQEPAQEPARVAPAGAADQAHAAVTRPRLNPAPGVIAADRVAAEMPEGEADEASEAPGADDVEVVDDGSRDAVSDDEAGQGRRLARVFFSLGNYAVGPNGRSSLEQALPELIKDEAPIFVVGSADATGSEEVNATLSDARAQAVAAWLVDHGVATTRIHARGIGNTGVAGNALDRRADIWLGGSR